MKGRRGCSIVQERLEPKKQLGRVNLGSQRKEFGFCAKSDGKSQIISCTASLLALFLSRYHLVILSSQHPKEVVFLFVVRIWMRKWSTDKLNFLRSLSWWVTVSFIFKAKYSVSILHHSRILLCIVKANSGIRPSAPESLHRRHYVLLDWRRHRLKGGNRVSSEHVKAHLRLMWGPWGTGVCEYSSNLKNL